MTDLYEAAARATINERCAPAFLHDVRGSLQALFGAVELLGRSAKTGGGDLSRVEKACDLARRAIHRHEKSTVDTLQILTSERSMTSVEIGALTREVVHFLRNDAANKTIRISFAGCEDLHVWANRGTLRTLMAGLLAAAIDESSAGAELPVSVGRAGRDAAVSIGSHAGFDGLETSPDLRRCSSSRFHPKELTLLFARGFLAANGGRLAVDKEREPKGSLTVFYPAHGEPTKSFAALRESETEK